MKKYNPEDSLTQRERSIIVGSILGDAYISRGMWNGKPGNARVKFTQGLTRLPYLQWKQQELKRWVNTPISDKPLKTQFGGTVYNFSTTTHPLFTEIYQAVYPEGGKIKRLSPQILEWLDDLALAVWFMDDGTGSYSDARIATYALLPEDIDNVASYLSEQGMQCKRYNTAKGPILNFSAKGKKALYPRIEPFIHPALQYKIGISVTRMCHACGKDFELTIATSYPINKITCSPACATTLGHINYPGNWKSKEYKGQDRSKNRKSGG